MWALSYFEHRHNSSQMLEKVFILEKIGSLWVPGGSKDSTLSYKPVS